MKYFKREVRKNSRKGFTLVEFLVTIGLVMILSTIGLINLYGRNKSEKFNSALNKLVHTMNEGVDNAKTLKDISDSSILYKSSSWRVEFLPRGCSGQAGRCGLQGPGYCLVLAQGAGVYYNYGTYTLPAEVDFDPTQTPGLPTPPNCSPKAISFTSLTGVPTDVTNAKVKIYLVNNPSVSSTVSVSALSQVSFTSDETNLGR